MGIIDKLRSLWVRREATHDVKNQHSSDVSQVEEVGAAIVSQQKPTIDRPLASDDRPTCIHIHIPKTAGTTVNLILGENFAKERKHAVKDEQFRSFLALPEEERHQQRFLFGHISYGLHAHLSREYRYIFVLREPKARIYSYYRYLSTREDHPDYPLVGAEALTFEEFLALSLREERIRRAIDNYTLYALTGEVIRPDVSKHDVFRRAVLRAFDVHTLFGFSENMPEFYQLLYEQGIIRRLPDDVRTNTTGSASDRDAALASLGEEALNLLEEYTLWDSNLYELCWKFRQMSLPKHSAKKA